MATADDNSAHLILPTSSKASVPCRLLAAVGYNSGFSSVEDFNRLVAELLASIRSSPPTEGRTAAEDGGRTAASSSASEPSSMAMVPTLLEHTPHQHLPRVASTLCTFFFLYTLSTPLSLHSSASLSALLQRAHLLLSQLHLLPAPDCPEMEDVSCKPSQVTNQKLNRFLFSDVDDAIREQWRTTCGASEELILAWPIIEWADNIISGFISRLEAEYDGMEAQQKVALVITEGYCVDSVKGWLEEGWKAISREWERVQDDHENDGIRRIVDRLRCDMCYPARLSLFH